LAVCQGISTSSSLVCIRTVLMLRPYHGEPIPHGEKGPGGEPNAERFRGSRPES
jgi:hypothetical protein